MVQVAIRNEDQNQGSAQGSPQWAKSPGISTQALLDVLRFMLMLTYAYAEKNMHLSFTQAPLPLHCLPTVRRNVD